MIDYTEKFDSLLATIGTLVERLAPVCDVPADFSANLAFRWERTGDSGRLVAVPHPHLFDLAELVGIDDVRDTVIETKGGVRRVFARGLTAV